jgi:hypothetical protein
MPYSCVFTRYKVVILVKLLTCFFVVVIHVLLFYLNVVALKSAIDHSVTTSLKC